MKKQFDRSSHVVQYNVGDFVYVWKPAPAGCDHRKFYDHFKGPYKIISKVTEYTFRIDLGNDKHDIVHMEKLRSAKTPIPQGPSLIGLRVPLQEPLVPRDESDDDSSPLLIFDRDQVDSSRPSRSRQPVRRLAYSHGFNQTEA